MAEIELETLIKSGADPEKARALVDLAYKEIKALPGLDVSKLRVPWSP
jgi:hypothetical protein